MKKQHIFKHESYHHKKESAYTVHGFLTALAIALILIAIMALVGTSELKTLTEMQ